MPRISHWNPLLGKPRYDAWTRLNPSHPFIQGLAGYWLINEEAGTKCYDLANGYHGTYSGTPTRSVAGGVAGLLPSVNNYVSVGDKTKLKITGAITLIADIWDNGTTRPQDYICGKVNSAWKYALWVDQGAQQVYIKLNTTDIPYPAVSAGGGLNFMKGRWNRIIGTWNGVDTGICSVNGLRNSAAYSTALANDTDPFGIGARGGAGQPFNCPISFVAVYARGFSANEIREINAYPFGTPDNPCLITKLRRTWFIPAGAGAPIGYPIFSDFGSSVVGGAVVR